MIMEGSSTSTGSSRRVALIACAAAGAAGYVWLRSRARAPRGGGYATDFESFLVAPVPSAAPAAPLSSSKKQQHAATAFESFLKVAPVQEQPAATDFASFLIDRRTMAGGAAAGADAQAAAAAAAAEPAEPVPEGSVPVAVLYGTEYGFAREIGEKLAASLKATGRLWCVLCQGVGWLWSDGSCVGERRCVCVCGWWW
jgi:sulfite reductase (NADPH) flavoprotein alpha-component